MRLFTLALLVAVCGCTSVVPPTVLRLNALSPLSADPAGFAIRISPPTGIDVAPGTAILGFGGQQTPQSAPLTDEFTLSREGDVFRVDPADLDRMRQLQETFRAWEAADSDAASGSLSIGITPCTRDGGPEADARVSVAIQVAQGGPFLPLIRNGPLSAVADDVDIQALGPCP